MIRKFRRAPQNESLCAPGAIEKLTLLCIKHANFEKKMVTIERSRHLT
jgi:hypothetical protein